jgi:hypothetical protein
MAATYVSASGQKVTELLTMVQGPYNFYVDLEGNQLASPALAGLLDLPRTSMLFGFATFLTQTSVTPSQFA